MYNKLFSLSLGFLLLSTQAYADKTNAPGGNLPNMSTAAPLQVEGAPWNWQLPNWPAFSYDPSRVSPYEKKFLLGLKSSSTFVQELNEDDLTKLVKKIVDHKKQGTKKHRKEDPWTCYISSIDAYSTCYSSLWSSGKHSKSGVEKELKKLTDKENGMTDLLCTLYKSYDKPLSHEMLWQWHRMLFEDSSAGHYRTHLKPMHIVSKQADGRKVHFVAPSSKHVLDEMTRFINWFNSSRSSQSILGRAAIAHVYFESIHPFEDGNGRIGRILVEKVLSQEAGHPALIAISQSIAKHKKEYYKELEKCNQTLDVQGWVEFFAKTILRAQEDSEGFLKG